MSRIPTTYSSGIYILGKSNPTPIPNFNPDPIPASNQPTANSNSNSEASTLPLNAANRVKFIQQPAPLEVAVYGQPYYNNKYYQYESGRNTAPPHLSATTTESSSSLDSDSTIESLPNEYLTSFRRSQHANLPR